jgi:murein DD-endopeptidase MepM/ murein hydrolase activator NlpD
MEGVYLTSNSASDHVRFRYMHMHPRSLDDDNVLSGRAVKDGEVIGKAGNFNRRDNLTTYHLHFELMVPTRDGWARVNPYMTLVASYERLIGARGTQVADPEPVPDAAALTSEASEQKAEKTSVKAKKKKRHKSKKKRRR